MLCCDHLPWQTVKQCTWVLCDAFLIAGFLFQNCKPMYLIALLTILCATVNKNSLISCICVVLHIISYFLCETLPSHRELFTLCFASISFLPSFLHTLWFHFIECEHFKGFMLDFSLPFPSWCFPFQLTAKCTLIQSTFSLCQCCSHVPHALFVILFSSPFLFFLCFPFLTCEHFVSSKTPTFGCSLHFVALCLKCFCAFSHLP